MGHIIALMYFFIYLYFLRNLHIIFPRICGVIKKSFVYLIMTHSQSNLTLINTIMLIDWKSYNAHVVVTIDHRRVRQSSIISLYARASGPLCICCHLHSETCRSMVMWQRECARQLPSTPPLIITNSRLTSPHPVHVHLSVRSTTRLSCEHSKHFTFRKMRRWLYWYYRET